jgi:hypothetical protein
MDRKNNRAYLIPWLIKAITSIFLLDEPIIQRHRNFAEILLLKQILVPNDNLNDSDLVGKRQVDWKIEGGILRAVDRIEGPFDYRSLLAVIKDGHDDKAAQVNQKTNLDIV